MPPAKEIKKPRAVDPWARVMGLAAELNSPPELPSSPEPDQVHESLASMEHVDQNPLCAQDRKQALAVFRLWAKDSKAVSAHMAKHDLKGKLSKGKPLVKISDFLPPDVAAGALEVIRECPEGEWESANAEADAKQAARSYGAGSTGHEFEVGDGGGGSDMQLLMGVVAAAMPDRKIHTLQAARYRHGGYIEPHDDAAYADAVVDGKKTLCSREYAIIFYLTKDWDASCGGCLVDHKSTPPRVLLPEFNSIVSFRVPRLHEVLPVTGKRARYSIFGWFLAPGRLYKVKDSGRPLENNAQILEAGGKGHVTNETNKKRKRLSGVNGASAAESVQQSNAQRRRAQAGGDGESNKAKPGHASNAKTEATQRGEETGRSQGEQTGRPQQQRGQAGENGTATKANRQGATWKRKQWKGNRGYRKGQGGGGLLRKLYP